MVGKKFGVCYEKRREVTKFRDFLNFGCPTLRAIPAQNWKNSRFSPIHPEKAQKAIFLRISNVQSWNLWNFLGSFRRKIEKFDIENLAKNPCLNWLELPPKATSLTGKCSMFDKIPSSNLWPGNVSQLHLKFSLKNS